MAEERQPKQPFLTQTYQSAKQTFNPNVLHVIENWDDYASVIGTIKKIASSDLDLEKLGIPVVEAARLIAQTAWINHAKFRGVEKQENLQFIERALELAGEDQATCGLCYYIKSSILRGNGNLVEAEDTMNVAMGRFKKLDWFVGSTLKAHCLNNLALSQMWQGKNVLEQNPNEAKVNLQFAEDNFGRCTHDHETESDSEVSYYINVAEGNAQLRSKMNLAQLYTITRAYSCAQAEMIEVINLHRSQGASTLVVAYAQNAIAEILMKNEEASEDDCKFARNEALEYLKSARQAYEAVHTSEELADNSNYQRLMKNCEILEARLQQNSVATAAP